MAVGAGGTSRGTPSRGRWRRQRERGRRALVSEERRDRRGAPTSACAPPPPPRAVAPAPSVTTATTCGCRTSCATSASPPGSTRCRRSRSAVAWLSSTFIARPNSAVDVALEHPAAVHVVLLAAVQQHLRAVRPLQQMSGFGEEGAARVVQRIILAIRATPRARRARPRHAALTPLSVRSVDRRCSTRRSASFSRSCDRPRDGAIGAALDDDGAGSATKSGSASAASSSGERSAMPKSLRSAAASVWRAARWRQRPPP